MGYVLGLSVGTESVRAALFDANGNIPHYDKKRVARQSQTVTFDMRYHAAEAPPEPSQLRTPPERLLARIVETARQVAIHAVADADVILLDGSLPLLGIAVGWPTAINRWTKVPTSGSLSDSGWRTVDATGSAPVGLDALVAKRFGLATARSHAINDANAAALATIFDHYRADPWPAKKEDPTVRSGVILALRIGGGVGAGTIVKGSPRREVPRSQFLTARLVEGASGYAGEIGHWQVPENDVAEVFAESVEGLVPLPPRRCPVCGRKHCLESFAGGGAFVRRLELSGVLSSEAGTRRSLTSALREALRMTHDHRVAGALKDIGRLIGRSLAAPVMMLNPDSITVTGSLALEHVERGIEEEKRHWEHTLQEGVGINRLEGFANSYVVARGAALAAFRGELYRRLDDEGLDLSSLTAKLTGEEIERWE
jgi:predicted NBD/HSP70 family sugar kinase